MVDSVLAEAPKHDWWRDLGDRELDRLVDLAIRNNADLRAATANLKATRELVREARAAKSPLGGIEASVLRARTAGASLQLDSVGGPEVLPSQTLVDAGTSLSWELDFAGRLAATQDVAQAEAGEALWLRRGVEASVATSVVRAWADLAYSRRQLALLDQRQHLLADVAARLKQSESVGGVRRDAVLDAQIALGHAVAERPALATAQRNALRRLATLAGIPAPDGVLKLRDAVPSALPVPQIIRAGDPSAILRLRPDVAAAEQELLVAMSRVRIAKADLYPRISLFGSIGINASPGRVTDEGALRFGIGPMLSWGIFEMDRIRARIRSNGAQAEAAGARWEASFMKALEETDSALDRFAAAIRTRGIAREGLARATQLSDLARDRHEAGADSYLTAALARENRIRAAGEVARAEATTLNYWIEVQTALGAGWRE